MSATPESDDLVEAVARLAAALREAAESFERGTAAVLWMADNDGTSDSSMRWATIDVRVEAKRPELN